mmetsp:Transcript_34646/g.62848  ORF Transcript_34646/g.62848 Transcript_34646/m.62848 type:complete len:538 (+) Transcript_34646:53-1666(+)
MTGSSAPKSPSRQLLGSSSVLGNTDSLRLELELPSAAWQVGDDITIFLLLENWSANSMVIALGNHSPGTSCSAALAAAGLKCEILGEMDWAQAVILEPRGLPVRQRAIFMPPWQATRLPLAGAVVSAGSFSGPALRFGGQRGDAAEILLPLSSPGVEVPHGWPLRPRLRFGLKGKGKPLATALGPIVFVGPHEPREASEQTKTWKGESQSEAFEVEISSSDGRKEVTREQAAKNENAGRVWQTKLHHASETEMEDEFLARHLTTQPAPKKKAKGSRRRSPLLKREAGAVVTRAMEDAMEESSAKQISRPTSKQISRPTTRGAATSTAPSSAVQVSDLDFEALPGSAAAVDGANLGLTLFEEQPLRSPRSARLPALSSLEHCAHWRGLGRKHDLMADPCLLEVAEEVSTLLGPSTMVAICGEWLQSRTGRRFVEAVRGLGARVVPAPTARSLHSWAARPRSPGQLEELVLVAKWQSLQSSVASLRKAIEERTFGSTSLVLRGAVALCERCEEEQATAAAAASELQCRWLVIPSVAFAL